MGMQVGKKTGGMNSEINVTPMADVMLVLLIIIMLIAPLLQKGVDVTLPQASNTVEKASNDEQTVLAVSSDGRFFVDQILTQENELLSTIQNTLDRKFEKILLIKADESARYSAIMSLLDQLQRAGIEDIGLITERRLSGAGGGGD